DLAKVEVTSSNLVTRSKFQEKKQPDGCFFCFDNFIGQSPDGFPLRHAVLIAIFECRKFIVKILI
ncbi:hypothetical protein, partial [Alkalimonas sp.]|uniref:hypothetical protein n=1 Tax=Alkalimonas sp. TaxID=1872453 RepID=UPI00263B0F85